MLVTHEDFVIRCLMSMTATTLGAISSYQVVEESTLRVERDKFKRSPIRSLFGYDLRILIESLVGKMLERRRSIILHYPFVL